MTLEIIYDFEDVKENATTVKTFDKQIWINRYDGTFINATLLDDGYVEKIDLNRLYHKIKTVREQHTMVAKRVHPSMSLVRVTKPIKHVLIK